VEGAVSSDADAEKLLLLRARSTMLVSLGDCAVSANVPGMRNRFPLADVFRRVYEDNANRNPQIPREDLPRLLDKARPVHEFVTVDVFLPGCPPPANAIVFMLQEVLAGRIPDLSAKSRFGA
jgi:NAD-reducing hydrogenase small subunit